MSRFAVAALLSVSLLLSGCAWSIRPPEDVRNPVTVYVNEYGRHTRVAVPAFEANTGQFVEFGFGEWRFYGLEDRGATSAVRAALGFGSGAMSMRHLKPNSAGVLTPAETGGTRSESIIVERSHAEELRNRLAERWISNPRPARERQVDGVPVKPDPARYHLFDNSNHAAARWLSDLGCRVTGFPILSNFVVKQGSNENSDL